MTIHGVADEFFESNSLIQQTLTASLHGSSDGDFKVSETARVLWCSQPCEGGQGQRGVLGKHSVRGTPRITCLEPPPPPHSASYLPSPACSPWSALSSLTAGIL